MTAYLNIGLAREDKSLLTLGDVEKALFRSGVGTFSLDCRQSDTELTVIVTLSRPLAMGQANEIAEWLDQDCIAHYDADANEGRLIGPKAEAWGPFSLDYFLFPTHLVA